MVKTKCNICNKKLSSLNALTNKCKCGLIFCTAHRLPETHDCSFNFKSNDNEKKILVDQNKCVTSKVDKI